MSIPTLPSALKWLAAAKDGPILVLLALVLVALGLGLWTRRARG